MGEWVSRSSYPIFLVLVEHASEIVDELLRSLDVLDDFGGDHRIKTMGT